MRSVILFHSCIRASHDSIALPDGLGYVRAVEFIGNIDEALDEAGDHMLPGESVCNTHLVEE